MGLDEELEIMEESGETDAEQIDEETEIQDVEGDLDEILGEDAEESDLEHAYASFETDDEADYDGWSDDEVAEGAGTREVRPRGWARMSGRVRRASRSRTAMTWRPRSSRWRSKTATSTPTSSTRTITR